MKTKIATALILNTCIVTSTIAGDIYRWTDPDTGKVLTTSYPPPYSIKEWRPVGVLPSGNVVDVILDLNAPDVKIFVDKHKSQEVEREQKEKKKAAQEAKQQEEKQAAIEKEKEIAVKESEEKRIAQEKEIIKLAIEKVRREEEERPIREAEEKRIADKKAAEEKRIADKKAAEEKQREREQREQAIREAKEKRIVAEETQKLQQKITKAKSKKDNDKDINFMLSIIDEFEQYTKFASSTARINLAIPINNLLNTKIKIDSYKISECYVASKNQLQEWMDLTIKSYYTFSANEEYQSTIYMIKADKEFKKFWLDFPDSCGLWSWLQEILK